MPDLSWFNNKDWWESSGKFTFLNIFRDTIGREPTESEIAMYGPTSAGMNWDDVPAYLLKSIPLTPSGSYAKTGGVPSSLLLVGALALAALLFSGD